MQYFVSFALFCGLVYLGLDLTWFWRVYTLSYGVPKPLCDIQSVVGFLATFYYSYLICKKLFAKTYH